MRKRIELQAELESVLGSRNVYFQPPETLKVKYPCIIYKRNSIQSLKADDHNYIHNFNYELTLIDKNPDSELIEKILAHFEYIRHTRFFTSDNINHDVFNLYY